MKVALGVLSLVVVPLILQEFLDWCPWLSKRLIRAAARRLPVSFRQRYEDEWLAEVGETPGKLAKIVFGAGVLITAGRTAKALDGRPAGFKLVIKGTLDRTVAAIFLVLLAPVLLATAAVIRLTSPGPAVFRQTRVGRGGREFTMLKFRSMYVDAEARHAELLSHGERADGLLFKMRNDPRITPVGRLLRKPSLDELPQLVNVLTGSMSLVGPRPPLPSEVALYEDDVRRRLLVKPGLTGLWQISGRSNLTWEESVRLDLRYVDNWSVTLDLLILWRTVSVVLRELDTRLSDDNRPSD